MLESFTVENYKKFKEPITINFSQVHDYRFNAQCVKNDLLSKAIIYGPNSSGKSTLGFALFDIVSLLTDKNKAPEQMDSISFLNADSDAKVARFEYSFKKDDSHIVYSYKKSDPVTLVYEELIIDETKINKLNHIIAVNLKAPIYLMHKAVPYMKKNNFGRIINIGSISGVMGEANASLYSATKAGLIGLSKATGLELAQYGITVNTINPGWVDTDLSKDSIEESEFSQEEILDCIPQKRYVEPKEVASMVKYLISEEAKGITGQSINICAGLSVGI